MNAVGLSPKRIANIIQKKHSEYESAKKVQKNSLRELDIPYLEAVERGDIETEDVARKDQINLREGTKMAMGAKKRSAEETASPNNSDHSTAISSADGAKILNNLYNLAKKYQEKSNRPKTFIGDVSILCASTYRRNSAVYTFISLLSSRSFCSSYIRSR